MPRKRSEQFFITRARELDESDLWEHLFERMASALLPDGFVDTRQLRAAEIFMDEIIKRRPDLEENMILADFRKVVREGLAETGL
jgi:hypothetical protein